MRFAPTVRIVHMFDHFQAHDRRKDSPLCDQIIVGASEMNLEMRIGGFRQPYTGLRRVNTHGLNPFLREQRVDETVPASQVEDAMNSPNPKFFENWRYQIVVRRLASRI
jgi:hypothetical protein